MATEKGNADRTSEDILQEIFGLQAEEDVFGTQEKKTDSGETSDPFNDTEEGGGAPSENASNEDATPHNNDERRYQYWQSLADKRQNELVETKAKLMAFEQQLASQGAGTHPDNDDDSESSFPAPPMEPEAPLDYNYNDAMSDPSSTSAQYARKWQKWQQDMMQYSIAKTEWLEDQMHTMRAEEKAKAAAAKQKAAQEAALQEQYASIQASLEAEHGFSSQDAQDFVRTMSSPDSLKIENLVLLYKAMKGTPPQTKKASETFRQTSNAAKFPPAFASLPSGNGGDERSVEDRLMDHFIALDEQKRNW